MHGVIDFINPMNGQDLVQRTARNRYRLTSILYNVCEYDMEMAWLWSVDIGEHL